MVYYSFTTLGTIGFGDFHPFADEERIFIAFLFMSGTSIFSYMMGIFIEIVRKFQVLNKDLDNGDELTKFFCVLKRFNGDKEIDLELREKIELHFDFKWKNDRNQAIDDPEELAILE